MVRAVLVTLVVCLVSVPVGAAERDPSVLLDRLEAAWKARDLQAYLALWRFPGPLSREMEREYAQMSWIGEESRLEMDRPTQFPPGGFRTTAIITSISEPRGRLEQALFSIRPGDDGWAITDREQISQIDGLVHLSLAPQAFRADGMTLRLPDFEMHFRHGWLFLPPADLGPTALVFVGEATARFSPGPPTERDQLQQFCGRPELVETAKSAFIRIHPADLHRVLSADLVPAAGPDDARAAALRTFRDHADDTYQLDARLPRSPWWLIPSLGDAVVTFQTKRGALTFAVSQSQPEGISLFDRARGRQICLYPLPGTEGQYDEDAQREVDVVHHELTVHFDPDRYGVVGTDVIRLRLLQPTTTIRLRLDESLRLIAIRSREGGDHLFFRVRHQDSVMVSLGPFAGQVGEVTLTVQFAGNHRPQPVEHELMPQVVASAAETDEIAVDEALVYSNRTAWYPQGDADDYATADLHLDVPAGMMAVTGGQQTSLRTEGGRTRVEYKQELPGKYITVVVGRMVEGAKRMDSAVPLVSWTAPRLRGISEAQLAEAAAILSFYVSEFGPCPYPSLNVALVESRTPGGHSPPGMIVVSVRPALLRTTLRDDPASFPEVPDFFLAHELAHQWWGHGVSGENYHERWISEAFAQYAAARWVQHSRGEAALRDMLTRMGRWAIRYAGKGPIHLGHRLGHIEGDPQVYRAVVYDKGAYVLHMLRQITGDEAFRQAVIALQTQFRFQKIGTDQVREALEKESGLDLRPYFQAWIYGTSVPELRLVTRSRPAAKGFLTEITVHGADVPGPMPLELAVAHAEGTTVRTVQLGPEGGSWTVETPGAPRRVELNSGRGLLARVRRN